MGRLEGKIAVITGAAGGMGRATALEYLKQGAKLVFGDLNIARSEELLTLASELGHGESIRFLRTDVSREEDVAALIGLATEAFGGLDILFNNAGVPGALATVAEMRDDDWNRTFAMLLNSVLYGIKHGALAMRARGRGGSIINTSSTAGTGGGSGPIAYSAAKAAVNNLTQNAAIEFAGEAIRVNAIIPGGIRTWMVPGDTEAESREWLGNAVLLPYLGDPQDIAYAAVYLGSGESRYSTGMFLTVDGGIIARGPAIFPSAHVTPDLGRFTMGSTGEP